MNSVNKHPFRDTPLRLAEPSFSSPLTATIIDLEKLRVKRLGGPVHPQIFFQLKEIFQMFESLGSARIEGNNTTLAELVEKVIENKNLKEAADEKIKEIFNIEEAIRFIEENIKEGTPITQGLLFEVHKILMKGLTPSPAGEGSSNPGYLRNKNVRISNSSHVPPDFVRVPDYFAELVEFVNRDYSPQHHLLMIAMAHHRMTWIHPFDNGNGRMVRMLTYALLIKQGFQVKTGRILNPTAIFCMDREEYYKKLGMADTGEDEGILSWCEYVLSGLRTEIRKIDRLLDKKYLVNNLLVPGLNFALDRKHITPPEHQILLASVKKDKMEIKSVDIKTLLGVENPVQRARILNGLKKKGMLVPTSKNGRIYTVGFGNNFLLRGVVRVLEDNGFIPLSLNKK